MPAPTLAPTPVQLLTCPEASASGNRIFMKRDDLLPFSFGGNKVRIAMEFHDDMRACGCDALIMYGDLCSNLCRVLACLCREQDVPCLMVATSEAGESSSTGASAAPEATTSAAIAPPVSASTVPNSATSEAGENAATAASAASHVPASFNELIVRRFGVEVIECPKTGIADAVDAAFATLRARGLRPYYIYGDRTGQGNEGTAANAYAKAYQEILDWERDSSTHIDLIVTPYGTGCTQGGLVCGSLQARDQRQIVGISISSRIPERARAILDATVRGWYEKQGLPLPADYADHIHLECGYNCGGYGRRDPRVDAQIEQMLCDNAIPLDPTYTGKAFRGMLDYLNDHAVTGKNILFLHTGGLPLFFDYLAR